MAMNSSLRPYNLTKSPLHPFTTATFIEHVKIAALHSEDPVFAVRQALEIDIAINPGFLPKRFLATSPTAYVRRPLYVDRKGRFSILVMAWEKGQKTPLHDHLGLWAVESVYSGRLQITNYEYDGVREGLHQFSPISRRVAFPSEADQRIPPSEYHVVENIYPEVAISIHVFGGVLDEHATYEPVEGGYRKIIKPLHLT